MFSERYRKKASRTSKTVMIEILLKEYYDSTLEEARLQPKHFGTDSCLAEEDPKGMASQYADTYRDALGQKDRITLEYLYMNYLEDHEASNEPLKV